MFLVFFKRFIKKKKTKIITLLGNYTDIGQCISFFITWAYSDLLFLHTQKKETLARVSRR